MATKKQLQDRATELGLEFTTKTTKADLEEAIAEAETVPEEKPDPNKRCPVCRKVHDHVHA